MKSVSILLLPAALALLLVSSAFAQTRTIRIVTYNIAADTNGYTTNRPGLINLYSGGSVANGGVLEGIGEEILGNDPAQPLDILALQETTSNSTTITPIVNGLNTYYNAPGMYAMSTFQATSSGGVSSGGGPSGLLYNTKTVQLLASVPVDPPGGTSQLGSSSGEYREVIRYEFAPAGVTPTAANEFYIYVSHYKASTGPANEAARAGEAQIIRDDSATLPGNARILYVGDYNVTGGSSEVGYQTIIAPGVNQGIDPINPSGTTGIDWSVDSLMSLKTESALSLRYRDDIQIMTTNVYYGAAGGLALVPGTYHVFGNNGTVPYSGIVSSGNSALTNLVAGAPISASTLYRDLTNASDHLPVVADYTIPIPVATPTAAFSAGPTSGIAPLSVTFTNLSTGATSYSWAFGDGHTSTSTNPANIYINPGTYSVTLTALGAGGSNTLTRTGYIRVAFPPPVASFKAAPTNGLAPLSVSFTNLSTGASNYSWTFGDGNFSTSTNAIHTYTNPGTYSVTLSVVGPGGSDLFTRANYIVALTPPLPSALRLADLLLSDAGGFQFVVTNLDGTPLTDYQKSRISIYATTNLGLDFSNWIRLTNSTLLTNGLLQVDDTNRLRYPWRFYRAVETP